MNVFQIKQAVERESAARLLPWLRSIYAAVKAIPPILIRQKIGGDYLVFRHDASSFTAELKAERKFTGNLFIEAWSNKAEKVMGWIYTSQAEVLLYHFLDADVVIVIEMSALYHWCFYQNNLYRYREVEQGTVEQHNDTYGRLVPIAVLMKELPEGMIRQFTRNGESYIDVRQQEAA